METKKPVEPSGAEGIRDHHGEQQASLCGKVIPNLLVDKLLDSALGSGM